MRIEGNNQPVPPVQLEKSAKPAPSRPNPAAAEFGESQRLERALAASPEVRLDEVARAKALLANPNFPSDQQLEKVAGLLTQRIRQDD